MARALSRINKGLAPLPKREPRDGMSASHLANVRLLPCLLCEHERRGNINAHHVRLHGEPEHGVAYKPPDKRAVPLCEDVHHVPGVHAYGDQEAYFLLFFIQIREYLNALWAARHSLEAMERVTYNFRQDARQKRERAEREGWSKPA
jgi:hypothetical protein